MKMQGNKAVTGTTYKGCKTPKLTEMQNQKKLAF
jgi:hypothetical protein